jgi:integrase
MRQSHKRLINNTKLGRTPLARLREADVIQWRDDLIASQKKRGGERAPSSLNRDMADLRAVLNFALKSKLVLSNAAWLSALSALPGGTRPRELYLDRDQRRQLIEHCDPDTALLVQALCYLPYRPGAVAALTVGNFNAKTRVLTVTKDKAHAGRQLHLPPSAAAFFAQQTIAEDGKAKSPDAPMFTYQGKPWNKDKWKGPIKEAVLRAGLPAKSVAYSLRHAAITDLVKGGTASARVALVAGTSAAQIDRHYAHLQPSDATDALAALTL